MATQPKTSKRYEAHDSVDSPLRDAGVPEWSRCRRLRASAVHDELGPGRRGESPQTRRGPPQNGGGHARTALAQHPEIMIGELIIIFAHHAIALHLGIASQRLVLLVKLVGIAARAVIYPVAAIIPLIDTIGPRPAPAPTAAVVLTIINQRLDVLVMVAI